MIAVYPPEIETLRVQLFAACMAQAEADPDGDVVEHLNHRVLEIANEMGRALNAHVATKKLQLIPIIREVG